MTDLDPPYVYSVFAHDLDALRNAVKEALDNPIETFIPDYMRFDYVCHLLGELMEMDWRGVAAGILEERVASGEGALFEL